MKSKDVIAAILAADPSGEAECCVGNCDIIDIYPMPSFYDGCLQVLTRDPSLAKCYNVVGAKYVASGRKIQIQPYSIQDAIFSDEDLPVTYEGLSTTKIDYYEQRILEARKLTKKIRDGINRDQFVEHIVKRYQDYEDFDPETIEEIAGIFYDANFSYRDPLLKIPEPEHASIHDCREYQWSKEVEIGIEDGKPVLRKN